MIEYAPAGWCSSSGAGRMQMCATDKRGALIPIKLPERTISRPAGLMVISMTIRGSVRRGNADIMEWTVQTGIVPPCRCEKKNYRRSATRCRLCADFPGEYWRELDRERRLPRRSSCRR